MVREIPATARVTALVLSACSLVVVLPLPFILVYVMLKTGLAVSVGLLVAFLGSGIVGLLGVFGLDLHRPLPLAGLIVACWVAENVAIFVAFVAAAFVFMDSGITFTGIVLVAVAGICGGTGLGLLFAGAGLDGEERAEIFPEVKAAVLAAQSLLKGWKCSVAIVAGSAVAAVHGAVTDLFGLATGGVGAQPLGERGPWIGFRPDLTMLGLGYLAGPRIAVIMLLSLVLGQWFLSPALLSVFSESVQAETFGSGETGQVFTVSRQLGLGLLLGAVPGYLLWGLVRWLRRARSRETPVILLRSPTAAVTAACLGAGLLLLWLALFLFGYTPVEILATTAGVVVLTPVGGLVLVRGVAAIGIAPLTGLTTLLASVVVAAVIRGGLLEARATDLVLLVVLFVVAAALIAMVHAAGARLADALSYPRWAVSLQVPLAAVVALVSAMLAVSVLEKVYMIGSPAVPAPMTALFSLSVTGDLGPASWALIAVGLVLGLVLGCSPLSAVAAGLAVYLPPGLIMAAVLGGLLGVPFGRRGEHLGRRVAAGFLVSAAAVTAVDGMLLLNQSSIGTVGDLLLGELAASGWPALPTFALGAALVLAAAWLTADNRASASPLSTPTQLSNQAD